MLMEERTVEVASVVERPEDVIRGGMDSLMWLLNNAQDHDSPEWEGLVAAAREDRAKALAALDRLASELTRLRAEREAAREEERGEERDDGEQWHAKANELEAQLHIYEEEIQRRDTRAGFARR